jgi:hypothetical protein
MQSVALTQEEVDDFLAAGKRVAMRLMEWKEVSRDMARWTAAVERDAVNVGTLHLLANRSVPRSWTFKLSQGREEVLQWHFRPRGTPTRHKNPRGCPSSFPPNVDSTEQEHEWAPGMACKCARNLPTSVRNADHEATLGRFCERARIEFATPYSPPPTGEQLSIV